MSKIYEPKDAQFQAGERVIITERIPRADRPYPLVANAGDAGTVLGAHPTQRPMLIAVRLDTVHNYGPVVDIAEDQLAPEPDPST